MLSEKTDQLLKDRYNFIWNCGGHFEVTEFDQELNDFNRKIIASFYEDNPDCSLHGRL